MTLPIHKREPRIPSYWKVTKVERNGEEVVRVKFGQPFVFGNTDPYSTGKMLASQFLDKRYERIRVVDVVFNPTTERVEELVYAYR